MFVGSNYLLTFCVWKPRGVEDSLHFWCSSLLGGAICSLRNATSSWTRASAHHDRRCGWDIRQQKRPAIIFFSRCPPGPAWQWLCSCHSLWGCWFVDLCLFVFLSWPKKFGMLNSSQYGWDLWDFWFPAQTDVGDDVVFSQRMMFFFAGGWSSEELERVI